mmetsp:Transcript_3289/g.10066  ORF Transcript_3289/g.10066 Transcript_3289/m.10066 type:complete len:156 (+) Transcript_3289:442-909(+)
MHACMHARTHARTHAGAEDRRLEVLHTDPDKTASLLPVGLVSPWKISAENLHPRGGWETPRPAKPEDKSTTTQGLWDENRPVGAVSCADIAPVMARSFEKAVNEERITDFQKTVERNGQRRMEGHVRVQHISAASLPTAFFPMLYESPCGFTRAQ